LEIKECDDRWVVIIILPTCINFGHKNCLAFDNRPFKDVEEHDKALIERWNSVVGIDDDTWILGDFSWYPATKTIAIYKQLNGIKHLIVGNHDHKLLRNKDVQGLFVEITDYKEINFGNNNGVVLSHYPIPCFNHHYYGWYHLYGHVHSSFEWNMMERVKYEMTALYDKPCNMFNVGCMVPYMNFTPRTLGEIIEANKKNGDMQND
jgi:calcineurin-like phosphoesterase family protein